MNRRDAIAQPEAVWGAIDCAPGIRHMAVLRPQREGGDYLVVSHWTDRAAFEAWS